VSQPGSFGMMALESGFHSQDRGGGEQIVALRRGRTLAVTAGAVVAVAVAIVLDRPSGQAGPSLVQLSATPLGVNIAPWDKPDSGYGASVMQPKLKAAGIGQLRYGGGSYADFYDWETGTALRYCLPADSTASFTSGCATRVSVGFAKFSRQARAIGAESFVTVNYGSGTPAMAAAWVSTAAHTPGQQVALWEVGNESYGCWEVDNPLAGAPANFKGYKSGTTTDGLYPTCPTTTQGPAAGMKTLATSYAVNALPFMKAMKAADPSAMIGVPWAFGSSVPGGTVPDSSTWNSTVLGADGAYVSFVDAHYYPFWFSGSTGGGNPSDSDVLQSLRQIPHLMTTIKAGLAAHDPSAAVVIGETAVSSAATTTVCTPVGAVFAAGDVLSWLAAGAQSVDWWDLNNEGNTGASCVSPDFGFFTSGGQPAPETPYSGYLLASELAQPGAKLGVLPTTGTGTGTGASDVLAFQAVLPNGTNAVAFVNLDVDASRTVTFSVPSGLSGTLRTMTYSAGTQNATESEIVTGTTSASSLSSGITLPAESITVMQTQ
jgi:hypothetical protein